MKKIGLFLTFLLAVALVQAQPGGGNFDPEAMVKRQVDQINQACSLTKDQVPKVETIVKKYQQKMMDMFQNGGGMGGDRDSMRAKMTKIQDDRTKEIKAVLTADQAKKYDEFIKEQQERFRQRMNGGGGGM